MNEREVIIYVDEFSRNFMIRIMSMLYGLSSSPFEWNILSLLFVVMLRMFMIFFAFFFRYKISSNRVTNERRKKQNIKQPPEND